MGWKIHHENTFVCLMAWSILESVFLEWCVLCEIVLSSSYDEIYLNFQDGMLFPINRKSNATNQYNPLSTIFHIQNSPCISAEEIDLNAFLLILV